MHSEIRGHCPPQTMNTVCLTPPPIFLLFFYLEDLCGTEIARVLRKKKRENESGGGTESEC